MATAANPGSPPGRPAPADKEHDMPTDPDRQQQLAALEAAIGPAYAGDPPQTADSILDDLTRVGYMVVPARPAAGHVYVGDYPPALVNIGADLLAAHPDLDVQELGARLRQAVER